MSHCKHLQKFQFRIPKGGQPSCRGGFNPTNTVYPPPLAAGNAGMAAAYAARKLGIPSTIVVPSTTPALTIQRLKNEGATVKVVGEVSTNLEPGPQRAPGRVPRPLIPLAFSVILQTLDEAIRVAKDLEKNNSGWVYVPPFDDPLIWYVEAPVNRGG